MKMFIKFSLLACFSLIPTVALCQQPDSNTNSLSQISRAKRPAFKGFELYSWEKNGQWMFSLLIGTNRNKTPDEIKPDVPIEGINALKRKLRTLAKGEQVFWWKQGAPGLRFPPPDIVTSLKSYASDLDIKLKTIE